jgi:hypothetical protein
VRVLTDAVRAELKANRYDATTGTLTFSAGEAAASRALERYWADDFARTRTLPGRGCYTMPHQE